MKLLRALLLAFAATFGMPTNIPCPRTYWFAISGTPPIPRRGTWKKGQRQ